MKPVFSKRQFGCLAATLFVMNFAGLARIEAQTFSSGSDGSDGTYAPSGPPGTVVIFDPSSFRGTQVSSYIFNFVSVTIPAGVTVRLGGDKLNAPVYWLVQGDVDIEGTIDLNGANGAGTTTNPFLRVASLPGAGGYAGGVAGNAQQAALPGNGPGGGAAGYGGYPKGGTFSGNSFLIPLIGGSGGGGSVGGASTFTGGGGAGGGALLIASSTQIIVNGAISANGGGEGYFQGGGGSGGAIRLVSNTITGKGALSAIGVTLYGYAGSGNPGQIRLESDATSFTGTASGPFLTSPPFPLLLPTAGTPTAKVISINGVSVSPNPSTFPDITINTTSAVPVVIQTHNIPIAATINLTILDENNVADTVISAPALGNCDASNNCTTTVNVIFPFGASRGLTKVTWTQ